MGLLDPSPAYKAPPPVKGGRATGEAFSANKSFYTKGYGAPTTKSAFIGALARVAAPMVGKAVGGAAIHAGINAVSKPPSPMSPPGGPKMGSLHPAIQKLAMLILAATPEQRKHASQQMATPSAIQAGRVLYRPLVASGLVRIT